MNIAPYNILKGGWQRVHWVKMVEDFGVDLLPLRRPLRAEIADDLPPPWSSSRQLRSRRREEFSTRGSPRSNTLRSWSRNELGLGTRDWGRNRLGPGPLVKSQSKVATT